MLVCPSTQELERFARGMVDDHEMGVIARHLGECEHCQEKLQAFEQSLLRVLNSPCPTIDEPRSQVAILPKSDSNSSLEPSFEIGNRIGEYQLLALLGHGGMASVYRAKHVRLNKQFAIKVLSGSKLEDPQAIVRFEREMKALGRLDHPNIVQATDAGNINGLPYLVMEFVNGQTLEEIVARDGPLSASEAIDVAHAVCLGLAHAHALGIVHRDIKPSNLIRQDDGTIKILDLGIALLLASEKIEPIAQVSFPTLPGHERSLTLTTRNWGTLPFMSPEQLTISAPIDHRSDFYSLGCTLYFLLTSKLPTRSHKFVDDCPKVIPVPIWQKLLAECPNDRFADAQSALAAFDRLREKSQPISSSRVPLIAAAGLLVLCMLGWTFRSGHFSKPTGIAQGKPGNSETSKPAIVTSRESMPSILEFPMPKLRALAEQRDWAKYLGTEVVRQNSLGMKMILIPAGTISLGGDRRRVIKRPYRISQFEVTRRDFSQFVVDQRLVTQAERTGNTRFYRWAFTKNRRANSLIGYYKIVARNASFNWVCPSDDPTGPDHPVVHVTPIEAQEFCTWLSEREGKVYRLPTEAEWLWALRGCNAEPAGGSEDWRALEVVTQDFGHSLCSVRFARSNAWEIFGMHRNLEMCSTHSNDLTQKGLSESTPDDVNQGTAIIARGSVTPISYLTGDQATSIGTSFTSNIVGFRVVEEVNKNP